MADEKINLEAAEGEADAEAQAVVEGNRAQAEVNAERAKAKEADGEALAPFPNAVALTSEDDLPSVEDDQVHLLQTPVDSEGWTIQSEVSDPVNASRENIPGYYVRPEELPTREGLAAHGIDPLTYLAGVPVTDVEAATAKSTGAKGSAKRK